ncbi:MAG: hypothetical protein AB7I33_01160 [Gemmatimonadales bacterium]
MNISRPAAVSVLLVLLFVPRLAAQRQLDEFSYDNLRFAGLWAEAGIVTSDRLDGAPYAGLRLDLGEFAPRVRLLVGASYFRSDFRSKDIREFENRLAGVVNDPDSNFTISLGNIRWSDLALDVDLQYLITRGRKWQPYIGVGGGFHIRNGSGRAIDGTFVEDALDTIGGGLGLTAGVDVFLTRSLVLNLGGRGVLSSDLNSIAIGAGLGYGTPRGR